MDKQWYREAARKILLDFHKKAEGLTFQEAEDKIIELVSQVKPGEIELAHLGREI